jgi:hypothetical protein
MVVLAERNKEKKSLKTQEASNLRHMKLIGIENSVQQQGGVAAEVTEFKDSI